MKAVVYIVSALFLASSFGCASSGGSNADKRKAVAMREIAQLKAPTKPLSGYANFEFAKMGYSPEVSDDDAKLKYADKLEKMLNTKLSPLFEQWQASGNGSGTLVIEPLVESLRIVSGGARFWIGAMAGSSNIEMSVKLIDKETGSTIAAPNSTPNGAE